jgi:hypothetical protein
LGIPVSPALLNGDVRSLIHVTHLPLHLSFCGKKAIGFEHDVTLTSNPQANPFSTVSSRELSSIYKMKLLTICDILNDEKFLVELLDEDLTFAALKRVIQDRGITMEGNAY